MKTFRKNVISQLIELRRENKRLKAQLENLEKEDVFLRERLNTHMDMLKTLSGRLDNQWEMITLDK